MCNCKTMCWEPDVITQDGRYPLPEHHPNCEDYKTEKFVRVLYDDTPCVMEPLDAEDFIKDADGNEQYILEDIYITRDQYENMPEFQGF